MSTKGVDFNRVAKSVDRRTQSVEKRPVVATVLSNNGTYNADTIGVCNRAAVTLLLFFFPAFFFSGYITLSRFSSRQ